MNDYINCNQLILDALKMYLLLLLYYLRYSKHIYI